jgi:zinc transport system ATP-binding protein
MPLRVKDFLTSTGKSQDLEEVVSLMGIARILETSVHDVSGGELQRVLLARALMRGPDLLILDEPTQGLDVAGQEHFYQLLETLRTRYECAVLMVSHDLYFVHRASDHVVCLNRHICCSGRPEVIQKEAAYQALFPTPEVALAPYRHHHDHTHDPWHACESHPKGDSHD